jgi:myo-inositol 2-dehydrogenase/D-chiro-inositol 1-dehydrogenase
MGIAGLGRLGQFHAENMAGRASSIDLVRVVDPVEDVARSTGQRLDVPWSTTYDDLLNDSSIEAVVIASPTPYHAPMIEQAAAAGKQIFCEKPVSLEREPAERAIAAARAAGVKLQIGFHRRFDPDWAAATSRIKAGEIGDVYLFRTSLRDMRPPSLDYIKTSGGFFLDVTVHDFDTARWMIGEIDEVSAFGAALSDPAFATVGDIDNAVVVLRFASGALGVIDNSRSAAYGYECSTEVMGSQATARIGYHRRVNVEWLTPGAATVDYVSNFIERYPRAYVLELEEFAAAVRADQPVVVTGEDALAAFTLCQAAERSFRQTGPVRLRHAERDGQVVYEIA